ncbi:PA2779 family protein [Algiphilus sp. W345]|uniref:PA2779 family protein n=1 Tax=Banduia mediterranea TaxID=3075609 RepID=A0ABU2WLA2_9GAMM|nr:PA2779 family protein [Algiphilus sp. W345]MDT0498666.1 PA2779 family protein [Algiphilus sp. W345]
MNKIKAILASFAVSAMLTAVLPTPALAAVVSTEQMMSQGASTRDRAAVDTFLARADVRDQLQAWGVAPSVVEQRVASLSDQELQELSLKIQEQPAGGDAIAVIGIVFLVLLILELVGVTNVFTSI